VHQTDAQGFLRIEALKRRQKIAPGVALANGQSRGD
jgi:hypothetical protein